MIGTCRSSVSHRGRGPGQPGRPILPIRAWLMVIRTPPNCFVVLAAVAANGSWQLRNIRSPENSGSAVLAVERSLGLR